MTREKGTPYRTYEMPTERTTRIGSDRQEFTHPAFATISASRVSGGDGVLFGSNINHNGHVRISIHPATMLRNGYSEFIHGSISSVVEVSLSEAQWVAFVSRMNVGSGTPCTLLHYRDGDQIRIVPGIKVKEEAVERMESQIEEMLATSEGNGLQAIQKLRDLLIEKKVPAKTQAELLGLIKIIQGHGKQTRDFQKKCLTETKERLVTEAKIEMDAMMTSAVAQFGLESIQQLGAILNADPKKALQLIAQGEDVTEAEDAMREAGL